MLPCSVRLIVALSRVVTKANRKTSLHTKTNLHTEIRFPPKKQTSRKKNHKCNTKTLPNIVTNTLIDNTPCRKTLLKPRKLFEEINENSINMNNPDMDIIPIDIDLEFLLLNSRKIDAVKVQTVVDKFINGKEYSSFFCFTETKVDSLDFAPIGIKLFSKHRKSKEKKGGGLTIGFKMDHRIKMEEIEINNSDVLALEGTIRGSKFRIILSYFDSTKKNYGSDFTRNRRLQKEIEKLIEVEPGTKVICLGNINGRLTKIEPNIKTDINGKMLEDWTLNFDLHHLNIHDKCKRTYTFNSLNGKSAIDHVLVNDTLLEKFMGMHIDEDRMLLNISDHCLTRVWFRVENNNEKTDWKKTSSKTINWVSKDEKSLRKFETAFVPQTGKKHPSENV